MSLLEDVLLVLHERLNVLRYNKVVGKIKQMVHKLTQLDQADPFRTKSTELLLQKLYLAFANMTTTLFVYRYNMGLITSLKSLSVCEGITASSFCRCVGQNGRTFLACATRVSQLLLLLHKEGETHKKRFAAACSWPSFFICLSMRF